VADVRVCLKFNEELDSVKGRELSFDQLKEWISVESDNC
jgi:hypothetical protein